MECLLCVQCIIVSGKNSSSHFSIGMFHYIGWLPSEQFFDEPVLEMILLGLKHSHFITFDLNLVCEIIAKNDKVVR